MFETMASFVLVEHANGAMFDPRWGARSTRGQLRRIEGRTEAVTARAYSIAERGVGARQHISAAAAPCLPLMGTART
jgi:hypothetical protein